MSEELQTGATTTVPTCYRHPDRKTRVSCGRCGRPLCPDCMQHGPVGVRCEECLRPPKVEVQVAAPERVIPALITAVALAFFWTTGLVLLSIWIEDISPNFLLSGIGGGLVGWIIWRICGRSHNRKTAWWAFVIGTLIPLLAVLPLLVIVSIPPSLDSPATMSLKELAIFIVRVLAAMGVSGLFAWLLATQRHWDVDLFHH